MLSANDNEYFTFLKNIKDVLETHGYMAEFKLHYSRIDKILSIAASRNESLPMISIKILLVQ